MPEESINLCIRRINASYEILTASEKVIADFLKENISNLSNKSCGAMAEEIGTSPATLVRFCKKIGFNGFAEMKLSIFGSWVDTDVITEAIHEGDSTALIKQKVVLFNRSIMDGMLVTLDDDSLEKAVDLLCSARRIMILGDGGSGISASMAYDAFLQLQLQCEYISDPFFQITVLNQLDERDVVIAFSNSGRTKNTIENCQLAQAMSVPVIGVVGLPNAPIAKYLTVEIDVNTISTNSFCDAIATRLCDAVTVSVLYALISEKRGNTKITGEALQKAYDLKRVNWKGR